MELKPQTLQKADITPKERILLIINDFIQEDKTGRAVLTEADKVALIGNWQAQTEAERVEFNTYNDGWRVVTHALISAEGVNQQAESNYYKLLFLENLHEYKLNKEVVDGLQDILSGLKVVEVTKAESAIKESLQGIVDAPVSMPEVVCSLAFESLDDPTKKALEDNGLDSYDMVEVGEALPLLLARDLLGITKLVETRRLGFNDCLAGYHLAGEVADLAVTKYGIKLEPYKVGDLPSGASRGEKEALAWLNDFRATNQKVGALKAYAKSKKVSEVELVKQTLVEFLPSGGWDKIKPFGGAETTLYPLWSSACESARERVAKELGKKENYKVGDLLAWDTDNKHEFLEYYRQQKADPVFDTALLVGNEDAIQTAKRLEQSVKALGTWYEAGEDGKARLANKEWWEVRTKVKDRLLANYNDLLAFKALFKRLNAKYEVDLGYMVDDWLADLDDFIATHNSEVQKLVLGTWRLIPEQGEADELDFTSLLLDTSTLTGKSERVASFEANLVKIFGSNF